METSSKIELSEGRQAEVFFTGFGLIGPGRSEIERRHWQGLATIIDSMTDEQNDEIKELNRPQSGPGLAVTTQALETCIVEPTNVHRFHGARFRVYL